MIRIVTASILASLAANETLAQQPPFPPSIDERVQALIEFNRGDFERYGIYLESMLERNRQLLTQEENARFNEAAIRNSILYIAQKRNVRLTEEKLKTRIGYARQIMRKHGQIKAIRDKIREVCDELALYYSVRVDDDAALKYRKCAAESD